MKYYQTEGIVNRLVPIVSDSMDETGRVDTKIMYKNLMENFHWAEQFDDIPQKDLETIRLVREMRDIYNRLAMALIKEHKRELALKVTARMTQLFPKEKYPYFYDNIQTAELFFMLEKPNKALNILDDIIRNEKPEVFLPNNKDYERKKSRYIESLHSSADLAVRFGMSGFAEKYRRMEGQVK